MAGGSGERFWPLSRVNRPKQLLCLDDTEKTMLVRALERISEVIPLNNIFIITAEHLLDPIRQVLADFPPENVIAEPSKRNTAPCLAYAISYIRAKYNIPDDEISVAVLTADHKIAPKESFVNDIKQALEFVEANKSICTIGIPPTRPDTAYGYIETDIADPNRFIVKALRFHEKPNNEKAIEYLSRGNFLWNSGMFFWRVDTFIEEMLTHFPEVGNFIQQMTALHAGFTDEPLNSTNIKITEIYNTFPDKSIDYALMEKSKIVYVCKATFEWDDIGSWDSLIRIFNSDNHNNVINGKNIIVVESGNTTVFNANNEMVIGAIGLKDIIIISTNDAVLVCDSSKVQDVKKIVSELKSRNLTDWL